MKHVHEIVFFGFMSDIGNSEQIQMMGQLDSIIKEMKGFVRRAYFLEETSKKWIDHVVWQDMNCAKRAAHDLPNIPECSVIFSKIDPSSIVMGHYSMIGKSDLEVEN